jgi:hypothetical protein
MKRHLAALSLLGVLSHTFSARAEVDELGSYGRSQYRQESEQDLAVELRFGRYVPSVDDGLPDRPYATTFGDADRYYGGLEIDWQVLRVPYFGTISPGFGIGYTRSTGYARVDSTGELSEQPTSLSILPMYVVAVVRADVIVRETSVPIVPYAKLGIGYALWWIKSGEETAVAEDGRKGRGRSYGPQFALGAMLQLDWMDADDAQSADTSIGMNHSYVFAEWYRSDLDGFGSDDQLNAGTDTWMVGLAAEF